MSPALPHTGAAYSFDRSSMGPWGGFITGLCENVEYVVTPAVIVTFITAYVNSIFGFDAAYSPLIWVITYIIFLALNIYGVALSYKVTLIITLLSLAVLVIFWFSAIPNMDFNRWALNIAPDGSELAEGNGPWFPFGFTGVLASLPFAVWLFLAIEQLPLAAEESVDPKRDMPKGILLGMATLVISAFMIVLLNPSVIGVGSHKLGSSLEPLLDGFRAIYGDIGVTVLGIAALTGLIASFHTILYAQGRQIYSLSRAGYFPTRLSLTHAQYKTPHIAMIRHHVRHLVHPGRGAGRRADWQRAAQHGGVRRHVLLHPAGGVVHSAPREQSAHRAALCQSARHTRRCRHHHHRRGDADLPDSRPELLQGRFLGAPLVRRRHRLFRRCRPPQADPLAGGRVRA
jgi:L-asparagine transporter-like permease